MGIKLKQLNWSVSSGRPQLKIVKLIELNSAGAPGSATCPAPKDRNWLIESGRSPWDLNMNFLWPAPT